MTDHKLIGVSVRYDIQPPVLECSRCSQTEILILPLSISKFLEIGNAFKQKHADCKEPE